MRLLVGLTLLLMTTAGLAGCIGSGETDPQDPAPAAGPVRWLLDSNRTELPATAFAGEFPAFDLITVTDRISGEPTLGITRHGSVFYAAIDFDGILGNPQTHFMRSTDGGETWVPKNPQMLGIATHPTSADPYVYVDPTTGRIFALDMGPSVACNKVSWSDDEGETWTTRDGACVPGANDHPTIFAGPATALTRTEIYPNQVYLCTNQITDSICYQSPDGGLNWIPTTPAFLGVNMQGDLCGGLHGHGHASWADATVYLGRDWCDEVAVAISRDGGITFEKVTIATGDYYAPADHDVSIGTDTNGTGYAFWVGDEARSVFLSRSDDMGASWSEPINVTAPGVTAVKLPSLVAGSPGRIAFQYIGTETPLGWAADDEECTTTPAPIPIVTNPSTECDWKYPDEINNTTWNAYIGISLNADTDDPVFATTTANDPLKPLKRGDCRGRCPGNGQEGGFYDFLDIDIDPITGLVWTALVDVCTGECDEPGKGWFDIEDRSDGTVAKMVAGPRLLTEPIEAR